MDVGIDIGNSNVTFGFKDGDEWMGQWRMITTRSDPFTFYRSRLINELLESGFQIDEIHRITISSVVPDLTTALSEVVLDVLGHRPKLFTTESYTPITVDIHHPDQLGLDLYANAVSAFARYNSACIVVDFGTALTFTSIDSNGTLLGVAITPGLYTALKSLSGNTAQLPEVDLAQPPSAIGKNTSEAIRAGIVFGYEGLIEHILKHTKSTIGGQPKVIATGGLSSKMPQLHSLFDDVDPSLTLDGIITIGRFLDS